MYSYNPAPIQSVSIPRIENRSLPTPHVVYAIVITLPVRSWTVYRRYSEFTTLHQALSATNRGVSKPPPAPLPPKHAARKTLNVVTGLGGLLGRGETGREQDEAMLQQRRTGLETYLRAIVSSQDPTWRESDEFRAFIELPKDHGSASALLGRSAGEGAATARRSAQQNYVPGSYTADSPRSVSTRDGAGRSGLTTRVLGTVPVRESQETRTLDDRGLMSAHQEQMDAQDRQLEGLAAILRRQKAMGLAINQELTEQTDLLDDLDSHVDKTQSKMRSAEKQMDRL